MQSCQGRPRFALVFAAGLACFTIVVSVPARAVTLIELPPPPSNASSVASTQYNAVAFSLTANFFDVTVEASLVRSLAGTSTGTAFLTTAVGPAATPADVIAQTPFTFTQVTNASTELGYVALFSGLTLPADDYFLVVGDPVVGDGGFISLRPSSTYTLHPNASVGSMLFSAGTNRNPAFAPGSTWVSSGLGNRYLRVSGEIPEPASLSLLGMACVGLLRRARRS